MRDIKQHITEDEFISFYLEDLPEEEAKEVDKHFESCVACAKELEAFYTAVEDFPTKRWEKDREAFIANLRQKVFPDLVLTYKEKLEALLEKISQEMTNMLIPSLAFKTHEPIDIETEEGIFGSFIEEESNGDINLYLDSTILKFEGKRIRFYAGNWSKEVELTRVSETQLGAKLRISQEERKDLLQGIVFRAKLVDSESDTTNNPST